MSNYNIMNFKSKFKSSLKGYEYYKNNNIYKIIKLILVDGRRSILFYYIYYYIYDQYNLV